MIRELARLEQSIGYHFDDANQLKLALRHRSCGSRNNERLEFLGDAVLGQIIARELFDRFSHAAEGELSRLRAHLVRGTSLAEIGHELNLSDVIELGPGEMKSGGHRRDSIIADTVEAVLGAIYLDGGYFKVERVVSALFASRLEQLCVADAQKDPKTRLQELLQGRGLALPEYDVVSMSGPAHNQHFKVRCGVSMPEAIEAEAEGGSRRKSEQEAAGKMLVLLQQRGLK